MKKLFISLVACFAIISGWLGFSSMSPSNISTHLQVDTITIAGAPYLSQDMKVTVAVPQSYFNADDTTHYPVVYLLNGHGGSYKNWPMIVPVDSIADAYQSIIICPSGMNSWYWDSPVDPGMQMESFFVKKLVPSIDSLYRTRTDRLGRAITGFSMGGHGGLWLGIRHSDLFGSAGASSGGVNIMPFPKNWNMATFLGNQEENRERWENHTVINILDQLQPGQLNVIFDCGTEDFFYDVNCDLDSALNARKIPHVYRTSPGAHNGAYWSKSVYPQLDFFYDVFYGK
ncbi:MAG: esterase family protein [Paramuribaculum sp.]|nr:esterase family protein [Paramuribaculum sp.]